MKEFLLASDMPNWLTLLITLGTSALTGFLTWLLQKRKRSHVLGLEVRPHEETMLMRSKEYLCVEFEFANRTDKRVIVMQPTVKNCTKLFPIETSVSSDISQGKFELKFLDQYGKYSQHLVTIDTGYNARTSLAVKEIHPELISHKPNILRRNFCPKYFTLEYEVLCGKRLYKVSTNY